MSNAVRQLAHRNKSIVARFVQASYLTAFDMTAVRNILIAAAAAAYFAAVGTPSALAVALEIDFRGFDLLSG